MKLFVATHNKHKIREYLDFLMKTLEHKHYSSINQQPGRAP